MLKVLDSAVPVACWSCSVAHNESTLFCPHCSKIQPPSGGDYFSVFGLVPRLDLDLGMLEHEFHKLSRKLHPDRFARATAERKRVEPGRHGAAQRCLSHPARPDPPHRIPAEAARRGDRRRAQREEERSDPSRVPADLLEEVFDLNMQLEEMRAAKKMGDDDPDLKQSLVDAKKKFDGLLDEVDRDLRAQWNAWDDGDEAARHAAQKTMVALLDRRRYLNNLVRDVTETLGA